MPADVFLAPHGSMFNLTRKMEMLRSGEGPNPFLDAGALKAYRNKSLYAFEQALEKQKAAE